MGIRVGQGNLVQAADGIARDADSTLGGLGYDGYNSTQGAKVDEAASMEVHALVLLVE